MYALIDKNNVVVNLVVWDGSTEWEPPEGETAVKVPDGEFVDIGYHYGGSTFSLPSGN